MLRLSKRNSVRGNAPAFKAMGPCVLHDLKDSPFVACFDRELTAVPLGTRQESAITDRVSWYVG